MQYRSHPRCVLTSYTVVTIFVSAIHLSNVNYSCEKAKSFACTFPPHEVSAYILCYWFFYQELKGHV